ncbi:hypothetical protein [Bradyrhizobium sp. CAR08]
MKAKRRLFRRVSHFKEFKIATPFQAAFLVNNAHDPQPVRQIGSCTEDYARQIFEFVLQGPHRLLTQIETRMHYGHVATAIGE